MAIANLYLTDNEIFDFFESRQPLNKILLTVSQREYISQLPPLEKKAVIDYLLSFSLPKKVRPRSALFRALGKEEPPANIEINQRYYQLLEIYKHDSWAATAIYVSGKDKIVCKFNRQQAILGIPMHWLGRRLAERENRFLQMFADLPNIPAFCGEVKVNGDVLPHVSAHVYVEGVTLRRYPQKVSDDFFPELQKVLKIVHEQKISYMDLNKRENIIVTNEGFPCLIDFQICFHLPHRWPGNSGPMRYLLKLLQKSDEFHLMKHFTRLRPDLFTPEELQSAQKRPWFLNVYRCVQIPLRTLRRKLLTILGFRSGSGKVTSEAFVEQGIREEGSEPMKICAAGHCLTLQYDASVQAFELISIEIDTPT